MRFSFLTLAASLAALATSVPIHPHTPAINSSQPFYLVTTTTHSYNINSSRLDNVSLTTLFDPYYQPNLLLRLTGPGYGSVPSFTLTDGVLHTPGKGPHGIGNYVYNSSEVHAGSELQFYAEYEEHGGLSLVDGYLLGVNGTTKGWTICVEELGQEVIEWKGTDEGCTPTFIQAALTKPY